MSKIDALLKSLSDHELAIYVGYQQEGFLKHTRERVSKEIEARNLSKNQLDLYFNSKISETGDGTPRCTRCGSEKFIVDLDIEHIGAKYGERVLHIESNRCRLCHLNPSKAYEKSLWKRIKRFFNDPNKKVVSNNYQSKFDDWVR